MNFGPAAESTERDWGKNNHERFSVRENFRAEEKSGAGRKPYGWYRLPLTHAPTERDEQGFSIWRWWQNRMRSRKNQRKRKTWCLEDYRIDWTGDASVAKTKVFRWNTEARTASWTQDAETKTYRT
jgi:hypothetical protein